MHLKSIQIKHSFRKNKKKDDDSVSSLRDVQKSLDSLRIWFRVDFEKQKCLMFFKDDIFLNLHAPPFRHHQISLWDHPIHSKILQDGEWDTTREEDKTNSRKTLKKNFPSRQALQFWASQFQREHHCPRIALSEHEARLHFISLRTIFLKHEKNDQDMF